MRLLTNLLWVLFIIVTLGRPALAAGVVEQARALYGQGKCKDTLRLLSTAERDPGLDDDTRAAVYLLQAVCSDALGKDAARDVALDNLVRLRPLFEVDAASASPPIRQALEARRAAFQVSEGVVITGVQAVPPNVEVTLAGTLTRAQRVEVFLRPVGTGALVPFGSEVKGTQVAVVVGDRALWEGAARATGLEVVVEVRDAAKIPLARLGDAVKPRTLPVTQEMLPATVVAPAPSVAEPAPQAAPTPTTHDAGTAPAVDLPVELRTRVSVPRAVLAGVLLSVLPLAVSGASCVSSFGLLITWTTLWFELLDLGALSGAGANLAAVMSSLLCCVSCVTLVAGLGGLATYAVMGVMGLFVDTEAVRPPAD